MKKNFIFLLLISFFFSVNLFAAPQNVPIKRIIYLYDGDSSYVKRLSSQIRQELASIGKGRYQVEFLPDQSAGWNPVRSVELLTQALANNQVDLIVVSGINLTFAALGKIPLSKPIVVANYMDPDLLGLPRTPEGTSGVPNLTYIARTRGSEEDFEAFRRIYRFSTLHILMDPAFSRFADRVLETMEKKDFQIKLIQVPATAQETVQEIKREKSEALYLPPLRFNESEFQYLISEINKLKIPTFSAFGYEEVEKGVLAGRAPKLFTKFSRRVAIVADQLLSGTDATKIPVSFDVEEKLVINQRTADQIGLSLPFNILFDAEILFQTDSKSGGVLTLNQAVEESLHNNLNFRIFDEQIKIASKDYWLAWTNYLPSVIGRLDYDVNDSERANKVLGTKKSYFGYGVSLNQLIFSHPVFFEIANSKKQINIEKFQRDTSKLDITAETIQAYLAYLSAKALHKVALDNLKAIEVNLNVAKKRKQTGAGGPEEVLRFESEYADQKSDVLEREANIYQSRVILNQLMNRPQETLFAEQEVGLETVQFYIGSQYLEAYVQNFKSLLALLEFATREAVTSSPEIQALDLGIEQQRNNVRSADGRFVLPEASFNGDLRHDISEKYYQSEIPNASDDWEFNVRMNYPLFDRGRRPLESMKERNELNRLHFARDLRKQEIERDLRRSAYDIYASLPSIKLKREALRTASENYEVVEKKYNEGIATVTELVDAQRSKFNREAQAVIAVYAFLNDLSDFDRQLATYYMIGTQEERQVWLTKLRQYFEQKGII